jgi:hypothetical protein
VPSDCPIKSPTSNVLDSLGICWLTSSDGRFYKAMPSRTVLALEPDEPNPFRYGMRIYKALVDARGNTFLQTTDFGNARHYVLIAYEILPRRQWRNWSGVKTILPNSDSRRNFRGKPRRRSELKEFSIPGTWMRIRGSRLRSKTESF